MNYNNENRDLFFDLNDIFSDRLLKAKIYDLCRSSYVNYIRKKYNAVITDDLFYQIDEVNFENFYNSYFTNRSKFTDEDQEKIDNFIVFGACVYKSNLIEELIARTDFKLT